MWEVRTQPPRDTLDATIAWVFLRMRFNTRDRIDKLGYQGHMAFDGTGGTLLCPRSIENTFNWICANQWSLEVACSMVYGIAEGEFTECRECY